MGSFSVTRPRPLAPKQQVRSASELWWLGVVAAIYLAAAPAASAQEVTDSASVPLIPPPLVFAPLPLAAASPDPAPDPAPLPIAPVPAPAQGPFNQARILGVMPDYQTITDPLGKAPPLTPGQKWTLALKETIDPFNLVNAAFGAGFSQKGNQTPKYGEGGAAYAERLGAAWADMATQNFFSAGLFANVLHEDPRYFRKGPGSPMRSRIFYSISRVVIARKDDGSSTFNYAGILGMMTGIAASNLYYPSASVRGSVMACRLNTSLFGSLTGNLMSEFWPDIQKKFLQRHHDKK